MKNIHKIIIIAVIIIIAIAGAFAMMGNNHHSSGDGPSYNATLLNEKLVVDMSN